MTSRRTYIISSIECLSTLIKQPSPNLSFGVPKSPDIISFSRLVDLQEVISLSFVLGFPFTHQRNNIFSYTYLVALVDFGI